MDKIKVSVSALLAVITAKLGLLAVPVYILVFLNIADYSTGIAAAYYKGERVCSRKGFMGIAKKISMWLLVAIGVVVDKLLIYTAAFANIDVPTSFPIGCLAAIWLICNEVISILENISAIGVCVPDFIQNTVKKIKEKINRNIH